MKRTLIVFVLLLATASHAATLTGFSRPGDPIEMEALSASISTAISKQAYAVITSPTNVDVSGPNLTEGDRNAIQSVITGYQYTGPTSGGGAAPIPPATTVAGATSWGVPPSVGTSTQFARADHTHGTPSAPTKATVGLPLVDNVADVDKPVSLAQQAALNLKADVSALPTKSSLGLANVDNVSDPNKPSINGHPDCSQPQSGRFRRSQAHPPPSPVRPPMALQRRQESARSFPGQTTPTGHRQRRRRLLSVFRTSTTPPTHPSRSRRPRRPHSTGRLIPQRSRTPRIEPFSRRREVTSPRRSRALTP